MTEESNTHDPTRRAPHDRVAEDDVVGRLVRLADSGPTLPSDGAQRVKDSLRGTWRQQVSRRRRQRLVMWGSGTLAAAALIALAVSTVVQRPPATSPPAVAIGRIAAVWGECQLIPPAGGPTQALTRNSRTVVVAGSRLLTGTEGRVAVALADGESLRLDTGSAVRLTAPGRVFLDRGAVYVDSHGASAGVVVATELGQVREIGTQFEVRYHGDAMTVRVREGSVKLSRDDAPIEVVAGGSVEVHADGSTSRGSVSPTGPEWRWVVATAPLFEIEGRTADAFLRWVARETGLTLSYADAASEKLARDCVLHGTLGDSGPVEAPRVVLPSCTMSHRIESGRLVVGIAAGTKSGGPGSTGGT